MLSETKREKGPSVSEVVFFKMMYKMKDLMKRTLDGEQRMTSIEIAEVTGKSHKNVMRDIRNMEPAWEKVHGLKFELMQRTIKTIRKTGGYIPLKDKDGHELSDNEIMTRAMMIMKKCLGQKENLIADLQPKADYCDEVLDSTDCLTMTQVAKGLGMTVHELTQRLLKERVIYEQSGQYMLYAPYARRHYARNRTHFHRDLFGNPHTHTYLVWTERGREFIHSLFC